MLNQEEKINEIYEYIQNKKKQEKRSLIFKWIFRILFIWYILYSVFVLIPNYIEKHNLWWILKQYQTMFSWKKWDSTDVTEIFNSVLWAEKGEKKDLFKELIDEKDPEKIEKTRRELSEKLKKYLQDKKEKEEGRNF